MLDYVSAQRHWMYTNWYAWTESSWSDWILPDFLWPWRPWSLLVAGSDWVPSRVRIRHQSHPAWQWQWLACDDSQTRQTTVCWLGTRLHNEHTNREKEVSVSFLFLTIQIVSSVMSLIGCNSYIVPTCDKSFLIETLFLSLVNPLAFKPTEIDTLVGCP